MPTTYATISDIRARGVTTEAADDPAVQAALDRAARMVDFYTGRNFLNREETYQVDGNGTESLFLPDRPILQVLDLSVDDLLVDPATYVLYGEAGYIRLDNARPDIFSGFPGTFPIGAQNVQVHGNFGFEQVPPEVNEATILLAMEILRQGPAEANVGAGSAASTRNAIGIKRVKIDEISVDFEYPAGVKSGKGSARSTGLAKADVLLSRFRYRLHPIAI